MKKEVTVQVDVLALLAGVLRTLSFVLLAGAVLVTVALALAAFALRMPGPDGLFYLLDEMDDELLGAFLLWGGFALSGTAARMLRGQVARARQAAEQTGGQTPRLPG